MITWVTVWILTVTYLDDGMDKATSHTYQLQYATQNICEKQRNYHETRFLQKTRCDFQQVPVYTGVKK